MDCLPGVQARIHGRDEEGGLMEAWRSQVADKAAESNHRLAAERIRPTLCFAKGGMRKLSRFWVHMRVFWRSIRKRWRLRPIWPNHSRVKGKKTMPS